MGPHPVHLKNLQEASGYLQKGDVSTELPVNQ